ncbi:MAG: RagB/SusD family nutrient uptake outer membrane protein [Flavipsychrobacter sp.]|nr:RagB/SusD family nutrient uptake outer membrane protein [Flavipsychrobacter sp.]
MLKKLILSLSIIAIIIPANSCKKFLNVEPVSTFGPDYVFANVTNATEAVLGVYAALTGDNGYGIRLNMYFAYDDDNIEGQAATPYPDNDRRSIAHYSTQAINAQIDAPFNQLFAGAERANQCIYYIPKMALFNSTTDLVGRAQVRRLYGEALTLRAQFYFELIRNWGDIPVQYAPSFTQTNLLPARTDRDAIYDHLLSDLLLAEQVVPWRTAAGTSDSRITCGAVRALRARIALFRAGWSLRQSGIMQQGSNPKTYYQIAMDECDTIITLHSADHSLNPNYKNVFQTLDAGQPDVTYGEVLWQVTFGGGTGTSDSKLGYYDGPTYTPASSKGNAALTILPSYFYLFDSTDARRDVTIAPYNITTSTLSIAATTVYKMNEGKFRRDWIPNSTPGTGQYFGASWPLIRYSDVLLMYAEADNEVNGAPSGKAVTALQMVSARGHNNNNSLAVNPPTSHDGFFQAIFTERSLELGGEGIRKYDLIRWNLLASTFAATKQTLSDMANQSGVWANYPSQMGYDAANSTTKTGVLWTSSFYTSGTPTGTTVTWLSGGITNSILAEYAIDFKANHSELLPIPQAARDANPNLTQNP